ncbi:MAG: hypothetical protein IJF87_03060 [Erysipelotrichaceae bacterium]|nr:hypothetical protein [Erysipelotrichaceae bacterium]
MKKVFDFFNNIYQKNLKLFQHKNNLELLGMSLSLLLGVWWPLAGLVLYLIGRFVNKKFLDYGKISLFGVAINYLLYVVQFMLKIAESI